MKIITMLLIMALFTGTLSSCGKSADGAEKVVDNFFTALKNNDFAEARKYVDGDDKNDYTNLTNNEDLKNRLKAFEYRVVSSDKYEDSVYVMVEITAPEVLDVIVEVEEDDGRWQIDSNRSLVSAVFGDTVEGKF